MEKGKAVVCECGHLKKAHYFDGVYDKGNCLASPLKPSQRVFCQCREFKLKDEFMEEILKVRGKNGNNKRG